MPILNLDHINIRTTDVEALTRFYEEMLGLERGYRPPFQSRGMWIYGGERPLVHLVEASEEPRQEAPRINHFAFRATGLRDFLARIEKEGLPHTVNVVPESRQTQVFLHDPDGNRIEMQFAASETDEAE